MKAASQKAKAASQTKTVSQKTSPWRALLLILFVGLCIYANTFRAGFHFDDLAQLAENRAIRRFPDLIALWNDTGARFLTYLTFGLNYFFHRLDVTGYHVVNFAIHITAGMLAFLLVRLILTTELFEKFFGKFHPDGRHKNIERIALVASLIFLAHPIQTEAVTYIIQRATALMTCLYLATLVFYFRWKLKHNRRDYITAIACCAASMLTKQSAASLPFTILFCETLFFPGSKKRRPTEGFIATAPFFLCLAIIPMTYGLRLAAHATQPDELKHLLGALSPLHYFLTELNVMRTYIQLLILPVNQNLDYDYPISHSLLDPVTALSALLLAAFVILAIKVRRKEPALAFGIGWFFLTLSVESSFIPLRDVIFEHRLYLPMVGFAFMVSFYLSRRIKNPRIFFAAAAILILIYSAATYRRNEVWKDSRSLWTDVSLKSPRKTRAFNNLALTAMYRRDYPEALSNAERALELDPQDAKGYLSLAMVYGAMGDADKETDYYEQAFQKGVADQPIKFLNSWANAWRRRKNFDKAEEILRLAIQKDPADPTSYKNLGKVLDQKGQTDQAIEMYLKSIQLDPTYQSAHDNLSAVFARKGDGDKTIEYANKAVALDPHDAVARNNLGVGYGLKGDLDMMIRYCEMAIEMDPDYVPAYANLALVYARKGEPEKAERFQQLARQKTTPGKDNFGQF